MTMPLSLKGGTYTSPSFMTDLNEPYDLVLVSDRILDGQDTSCLEGAKVKDSHYCRGAGRILDADWKIVDERGTVTQQGAYNDRIYSGEETKFGEYVPERGSHPRVFLRIHQDVQGLEFAHPKLEIHANPEYSLGSGYAWAAFMIWAGVVAGPGVIILLGLVMLFLIGRAHEASDHSNRPLLAQAKTPAKNQ
jgi:hypothetical protein